MSCMSVNSIAGGGQPAASIERAQFGQRVGAEAREHQEAVDRKRLSPAAHHGRRIAGGVEHHVRPQRAAPTPPPRQPLPRRPSRGPSSAEATTTRPPWRPRCAAPMQAWAPRRRDGPWGRSRQARRRWRRGVPTSRAPLQASSGSPAAARPCGAPLRRAARAAAAARPGAAAACATACASGKVATMGRAVYWPRACPRLAQLVRRVPIVVARSRLRRLLRALCAGRCPLPALCADRPWRVAAAATACATRRRSIAPWRPSTTRFRGIGLVAALKFRDALDLAPALARRLAETVLRSGRARRRRWSSRCRSARQRLRERGYNQAWELARRVARHLRLPADARVLTRTHDAPRQMSLPPERRAMNVRGSFVVAAPARARIAGPRRGARRRRDDHRRRPPGKRRARCSRRVRRSVQVWVAARTPAAA